MNRFDCLAMNVTSSGYRLDISSSDREALKWLADLIQKDKAGCQLAEDANLSCRFRIVGYKPLEIVWWIVQQLRHRGWEPFGSVRGEESWGLEFITLRRTMLE